LSVGKTNRNRGGAKDED